jgi:hypothetical protein
MVLINNKVFVLNFSFPMIKHFIDTVMCKTNIKIKTNTSLNLIAVFVDQIIVFLIPIPLEKDERDFT